MEKLTTLIILLVISSGSLFAQPSVEWQVSLGGTLNDQLESSRSLNGMAATNDGGFILAGTSFSNDGDVTGHHGLSSTSDYWVVKTDSLGGIEWQKSLGGSNDEVA